MSALLMEGFPAPRTGLAQSKGCAAASSENQIHRNPPPPNSVRFGELPTGRVTETGGICGGGRQGDELRGLSRGGEGPAKQGP